MANSKEAAERDDVESAIDQADSEREERESNPAPARPTAGTQTGSSGFRNVMTIAIRELRSYFDSLIAYVVLGGSMLIVGFFFFFSTKQTGASFWDTDRASMGHLFDIIPHTFPLILALVTMRALAEEKRTGTLELLITMPVRDSEVILGKYLAALFLMTMLLLGLMIIPVAMFVWPWQLGPLDWGPVGAGFLGLFCYAAAGCAFGLMVSSLTESQVISFFVTYLALTIFQAMGVLFEQVHHPIADAFSFISLHARYADFGRGLIDTKALVYFLSISIVCLLVSFRSLESRKWS